MLNVGCGEEELQTRDVERIVRRGGRHLAEALEQYWPTNGNNEVGERNITIALTRAFSDAGFHLYAEGHTGSDTKTRLDLLALNFETSTQVAIEAKRLYGPQQASLMLEDLHRVRDFELSPTGMLLGDAPKRRFGLIVATTWIEDYARWFSHDDAEHPTGDAWPKLMDPAVTGIPSDRTRWGSCILRRQFGASTGVERNHYLVYCLADLAGG